MLKKLNVQFLVLFLSLLFVLYGADSTLAAVNVNKEQLDKLAIPIGWSQDYSNMLSDASDMQYYKVTVTDAGYFRVNLKASSDAVPDAISYGWDIDVYSGTDLSEEFTNCNGVTSSGSTVEIPVTKGDYYIVVKAHVDYGKFWPKDCKYILSADFSKSNTWEAENNNTWETANVINENVTYYGSLQKSKDVDWYKVDVKTNGTVKVHLTPDVNAVADAVEQGWKVTVYDSNKSELKSYHVEDMDVSTVLPFPKGTYYVKVAAMYDYGYGAPVDCTYNLKVETEASNSWELESNNDNKSASLISVNKEYKGLFHDRKDVDWYKVKIDKAGYFKVQYSPEDITSVTPSFGFDITVYDSNFKELRSYGGLEESIEGNIFPYGKGYYYVKVEACLANSTIEDVVYNLKVVHKESKYWESEDNASTNKSDSITFNKTYNGVISNNNDVDWFKVSVKSTGAVRITLKAADMNPDTIKDGWELSVYNKKSTTPIKVVDKVTNKESVSLELKKGTYYIKVTSNTSYRAPLDCAYKLTADYSKTPSKASIKSITSKGKKVTLKWGKVKDADGYVIYRSTSKKGTYKKITTVKKGSTVTYIDKKSLKKGKTYYYKVVSYNKTGSLTANAAASKVKSVKLK